ncbi:hypothetical protein BST22_03900 [Mycolicibacterium chubuense]|uniref:Putative aliphatic sulfonates transport permease protein SsuC n=1 Tax=Mycolicibacterium chubuense TaxID=1800 RepID=A0A0J6WH96_MYCCU|nr:ABC transporter permease subunit [Mycolicibacterium chubuense]KMO81413.1 putative aliphatic sulfonates transport permease protein SsuC [Mycolicibacterium chubuense]ORA55668.1 hypothetical protein BST22_03900 [Mycolicibacterium chubuense]SPX95644.1 binding-protein-dependent transport systems inner membrane component [Mycolicibacterium chubuense]
MSRAGPALSAVAIPVSLIALWQLLSWSLRFGYLPAPVDILAALPAEVRSGALLSAIAHTLGVALTASAVAGGVGTVAGLAFGSAPRVGRWATASIEAFRTVPAVTLIPATVLAFGPTRRAEILLATYAAVWPIVLNTAGAVRSVHPRQFDIAQTFHLSAYDTLRKIVIPAATPVWLVGARLSVILAFLVTVVAEMVITPAGLGGALAQSLNALAPERMWVYAISCGAVGLVLNLGLRNAVGAILPMHPVAGPGGTVPRAPAPSARGLIPLAVMLVAWQLTASPSSLVAPPPTQWFAALADLHAEASLLPAVGRTLVTYLAGLFAATVLGSAAGAVIGASHRIDRAVSPSLDFVAAIPGAALVPVLVLLFGTSVVSGIAAVTLIVTWPILLSTATARRAVALVRLDVSRTMGLSPWRRWSAVILPSLTPGVLLGVRVSSALALIVALLTDIFGAGTGIGRLLIESQQRFDAATAWGLLLIVGAFGYLTNSALARLSGVPYASADAANPRTAAPSRSR